MLIAVILYEVEATFVSQNIYSACIALLELKYVNTTSVVNCLSPIQAEVYRKSEFGSWGNFSKISKSWPSLRLSTGDWQPAVLCMADSTKGWPTFLHTALKVHYLQIFGHPIFKFGHPKLTFLPQSLVEREAFSPFSAFTCNFYYILTGWTSIKERADSAFVHFILFLPDILVPVGNTYGST